MNNLPIVIQNIIINYKNGMEHFDNYKHSLNEINKIHTQIYTRDNINYIHKYFSIFNNNKIERTLQLGYCKQCKNLSVSVATFFINNDLSINVSKKYRYYCCNYVNNTNMSNLHSINLVYNSKGKIYTNFFSKPLSSLTRTDNYLLGIIGDNMREIENKKNKKYKHYLSDLFDIFGEFNNI